MYILGISAYYHDSAACIVKDGELIAAVQEERFTRIKAYSGFPKNSVLFCLNQANITAKDLSYVAFYEKPFLKFERLLETYLAYAPKGFRTFAASMPLWIKDKLFQKSMIRKELTHLFGKDNNWNERLLFSEHHLSHAASAFYPSPFREAAILTMDGVGEWTTTSIALGKDNDVSILKEIHFPHSLGLLYSAFTYYTGFKVNSGEYKVMGLAPYGKPIYVDLIKDHLIHIKDDGSFQLDMSYFDYCTGLKMTNKRFERLFGEPPREPESALTQRDMDLAASVQCVTEEIVLKLAKHIARETGQKYLCLGGGVALNCVANGALLREQIFDDIWIQPAPGDAGGAVGAALASYHAMQDKPRLTPKDGDSMQGAFLGPSFNSSDCKKRLIQEGANLQEYSTDKIIELTANALASGKAVGWMQGKMEFGPRALGGRSILADPRSPTIQKLLNLKVKYRESFRPFAPSVLREDLTDWFEIDHDSPYMSLVAEVSKSRLRPMSQQEKNLFGIDKLNVPRSEIPAVTHVDYSARIQTVHKETNPIFHALISYFKEITGCPVLVNTSFNVRGEPIVCTPEDAFKCFIGTELDVLVVENLYMEKEDQDMDLRQAYEAAFELD